MKISSAIFASIALLFSYNSFAMVSNSVLNEITEKARKDQSIWIEEEQLKNGLSQLASSYNTYNKTCLGQLPDANSLCTLSKQNISTRSDNFYTNSCNLQIQGSAKASKNCVIFINNSLERLVPPLKNFKIDTQLRPKNIKIVLKKFKLTDKPIVASDINPPKSTKKNEHKKRPKLYQKKAAVIEESSPYKSLWSRNYKMTDYNLQENALLKQVRQLGRNQIKLYTDWCYAQTNAKDSTEGASKSSEQIFDLEQLTEINKQCSEQFSFLQKTCSGSSRDMYGNCKRIKAIKDLDNQIIMVQNVLSNMRNVK